MSSKIKVSRDKRAIVVITFVSIVTLVLVWLSLESHFEKILIENLNFDTEDLQSPEMIRILCFGDSLTAGYHYPGSILQNFLCFKRW